MFIFDQFRKGDLSLRLLAAIVMTGMLILLGALWRLQIWHREKYQQMVISQSFKTVSVPALRGRILDRNGLPLADNQPRYRLDLYLDELRGLFGKEYETLRVALQKQKLLTAKANQSVWQKVLEKCFGRRGSSGRLSVVEKAALDRLARFYVVSNVVAQVSAQVGQQLVLSEAGLKKHHDQQKALPLPILTNATPVQIARYVEKARGIPGVSLEPQSVRVYPFGSTAAHVLGYVDRREESVSLDRDDEDTEAAVSYRLNNYQGATGVENMYEGVLHGTAGLRAILVNSSGYRQQAETKDVELPQPGQDIYSTLDVGIQQTAEHALAQVSPNTRGAVVVVDPRNGDLLALVSLPSFNPNYFVGFRSEETWKEYQNPETTPMVNRATSGQYPPGSTFKIVTALACLESGVLNAQTVRDKWHSQGSYRVGNRVIRDLAGAGDFDFRRAFIRSSNPYFNEFGLKAGFRWLVEVGRRFHLGERTGYGPQRQFEETGEYPEMSEESLWAQGDVANLTIGQGKLTVTPIQMAMLVSAVANGGHLYEPRLIDRAVEPNLPASPVPFGTRPGKLRNELGFRPEHLEIVRSAMRDDVAEDEGSGRTSRVAGMNVCGKTGTAQITKGSQVVDHVTWFVSFAPFEQPRYTVIVVVESGSSGGGTCGPVARKVYEYLKDRDQGKVKLPSISQK